MSGLRSSFMRKWLVTGMPSPMLKIIIIKQNSPRAVGCLDGNPWIRLAVECACWWLGEYKLYHSVWEPPIMCVAWEISRFLVVMLTMKVYRSKCYSISILKSSSGTSTNPCFPLRRAYLFTFMLSHHPLIKKHQLESTAVICMHCY